MSFDQQLALPLPYCEARSADDFYVGDSNREAARLLDAWPDWPSSNALTVFGAKATGKSHLLSIWAHRAGAEIVSGRSLTKEAALTAQLALAIDDADKCSDHVVLFHLVNRMGSRSLPMLMTLSQSPHVWDTGLPDLNSRLRAVPSVGLSAPDDNMLAGLAAKLFADRQITVRDDVIAFMLTRLERSCAAIADAVRRLDGAALAAQRPITVPLARQVLAVSERR